MKLWMDEEGASLAEYGLLLALIALACIAAARALGLSISALFSKIGSVLGGVETAT